MYKEIEVYLSTFYARLKCGQSTLAESKEVLLMLEKLLEMGLLDETEYKLWKAKLGGIYTKSILCLNLSTRAQNCLLHSNIKTWGELRDRILYSGVQNGILNIRNLGKVTACEIIKEALRCHVITKEELSIFVDEGIMGDLGQEFVGKDTEGRTDTLL